MAIAGKRSGSGSSFLAVSLTLGLTACLVGCPNPPSADSDTGTSTEADSDTEADGETDTGANALPPSPTLASPADGASGLPIETDLCWNPVVDPDGDAVRYRVFVDDIELAQGEGAEDEGYPGPCTGTLLFEHERSYAWRVVAFEAEQPERESEPSPTWTFSTEGDGFSSTVFEDRFDEDLGWTIEGDASTGAWVRGVPDSTAHMGELAQPGRCFAGTGCMFTGENPAGDPTDADVSGGSTVLLSPTFDLELAAAATVQVARFFHTDAPGPELTVELLVPIEDGSPTLEPHLLERVDATANAWLPVEYVACDMPMRAGSRLRITASDPGPGVVEAAIDSVSVHAYDDPAICGDGLGGACDPSALDGQAGSCADALLCCGVGPLEAGVHRCSSPVAGLDFDNPTESPDSPANGPLGCDLPDLIVDPTPTEPMFADIFVSEDTCELHEGCVGDTGWRRVMPFTAAIPNVGARDLALGVPANNPDIFHYSDCHSHHHFDEFARYEIVDPDDPEVVVATGHKQAFCMLDTTSWAWPLAVGQFDCANQGISRGFSDFYEAGLPCQWVDVTGVPAGNYDLRISLNPVRSDFALPLIVERDHTNNGAIIPITIPE